MSDNILFIPTGSSYNTIYFIPEGQTAQEIANRNKWAFSEWVEFDGESYGASYEQYANAFSISLDSDNSKSVSFNLTKAKEIGREKVKQKTSVLQQASLNGYTTEVLAAQATLSESSRTPSIQVVITNINNLNYSLQTQISEIDVCTNLTEINLIVNPPTAV